MVEDIAATLRRSWNTSLFAEVDAGSASGVIFGVQGPTHLFTTIQVDAIRRTLHELLAGKDAMLGIYPSEHLRWISYIGILTGMDVPDKVKLLLEKAKAEYHEHEQILEAKAKSKREGLGFSLTAQPRTQQHAQSSLRQEAGSGKLERMVDSLGAGRLDVSSSLPEVIQLIISRRGERFALEELVKLLQSESDIDDERSAVAAILELQNRGYLVEIKKNIYQVV
jgi:hypothetical protein